MFVEKLSALSIVVEHVYCKKKCFINYKAVYGYQKFVFNIFISSSTLVFAVASINTISIIFFYYNSNKNFKKFFHSIFTAQAPRKTSSINLLTLRLHALKIHFNNKQTAASTSHSLIQICVHLLILCLSKLHSCTE